MRRWILGVLFSVLLSTSVFAIDYESGFDDGPIKANQITTDTTNFNGNLTTSDTTLQKVADKFDDFAGYSTANARSDTGWTDDGTKTYQTTLGHNVGIGTTTPQAAFVVMPGGGPANVGIGSFAPEKELVITASSNSTPTIYLRNMANSNRTAEIRSLGSSGAIGVTTFLKFNNDIEMGTSSKTDFKLDANGNVGIGTTLAAGALAVMSGNVGIGTWVPSGLLTVGANMLTVAANGDIATSGGYVQSGVQGLIAQGTGTSSSNGSGRLTNWYDGVASGATGTDTYLDVASGLNSLNLRKDWGAGNSRTITGFKAYSTSDQGFYHGSNPTVTCALFGSDDASAWTQLATTSATDANSLSFSVLTGVTTTTAYRYHEIRVSVVSNLVDIYVTEAEFYDNTGTANSFSGITNFTSNVGIADSTPDLNLEVVGSLGVSSSSSGEGNRFIVNSSGNVGVGTTTPQGAFVVTNGNVGLGTWSPQSPLHVVSDSSGNPYGGLTVSRYNVPGQYIGINERGGNNHWISGKGSKSFYFTNEDSTSGGIGFELDVNGASDVAGGTRALTIMNSGNIGIGSAAPNALLNVGSGQITVPDGTAAAPGYAYTGATNTGFYRASTAVNLTIAGTDALQFTRVGTNGQMSSASANSITLNSAANGGHIILLPSSSGNVGIGTAIPIASLEVVGTVNIDKAGSGAGLNVYPYGLTVGNTALFGVSGANNASVVKMYDTSQVQQVQVHAAGVSYFNSGNVGIGTSTPQGAFVVAAGHVGIGTWVTSNSNGLTVMDGNVGIGTTVSSSVVGSRTMLHVRNNLATAGAAIIRLQDNNNNASGGIITVDENAPLRLFTNNVERLTIKGDGNVGIGTTTPQAGFVVNNGNMGIGTWTARRLLEVKSQSGAYSAYFVDSNDLRGVLVGTGSGGGGSIQGYKQTVSANTDLYLQPDGANVYLATGGGNVGIGTQTPVGGLSVMNGNVGLGTWKPAASLEVKTGDLYINKVSGKTVYVSPDGTCSSCGVDNADVFSCSGVTCPASP